MLDSFRKRDNARSTPTARPQSPYGQLQEALNAQSAQAIEPQKTETKVEPMKAETKPLSSSFDTPTAGAAEGASVSKLIVGPDIKLKGAEITDCDTLVVEGRVEASMDSRVIQIAEHGVFVGKVGIDIAEIRGRFEGELTARKQLVIRSTGRVSGKIRYGKVAIEEGGELSGDIGGIAATNPSTATNTNSTSNVVSAERKTATEGSNSATPSVFARTGGGAR
jgi:cytoskeletal protein CcmA (bactofilin family)